MTEYADQRGHDVTWQTAEERAQQPTIITGRENIEIARLLAVRGALKLETKGLKRHGRSARVLANEAMGTNFKTAKKTHTEFNKWLVENYDAKR